MSETLDRLDSEIKQLGVDKQATSSRLKLLEEERQLIIDNKIWCRHIRWAWWGGDRNGPDYDWEIHPEGQKRPASRVSGQETIAVSIGGSGIKVPWNFCPVCGIARPV